MINKILKDILKWGFLQIISIFVAYTLSIMGYILFSSCISIFGVIESQNIMNLLDSLSNIFATGLMTIGYITFWLFIIKKEYKKENLNIQRTIIYSLLPLILLEIYYSYKLSLPPIWPEEKGTPYGTRVLDLLYSLILFPLFLYWLNKYIIFVNNILSVIKRLVLLVIILFLIKQLIIYLTIGVIGLEKFNYLNK